jgi:hypothetical protein
VERIRVRLASTAFCLVAAAAAFLPASAPAAAVPAARANAASLGTVRLASTSGTVDGNPIFASGSTSAPCPAGYGADAQLRVGPPGGPFTNLARPLTSGGYDKSVVSARPNRSFTMALGGVRPADGEWWVVVECFSVTLGMHPQRFVTEITVSGPRWRIGRPAGSPQSGGIGPADSTAAANGTTDPAGTAGAPSASAGSVANGTSAATAPGDPRLAGNSDSGSASFGGVGAMLAVAGVLLIIGLVYLATRRSPAPLTNAKGSKTDSKRSKTNAKAKTRV